MDKEDWKAFFRWLDQAMSEEMRQKKDKIVALCGEIRSADVKSDARRMIRLIDQELLARESVARWSTGKRDE
jgi:hypothetical protein